MNGLGSRIKILRRAREMSQQELARLLGVSRPTVSQIESGQRDLRAGDLVNLSRVLGVSIDSLLDLEKEPEVVLAEYNMVREPKPPVRINVPQRRLGKLKEVLLYILAKVGSKPNFGETVLYKILYFIDFDYYEKYEEQMIGATYIKNHYGPTPAEFRQVAGAMIKKNEILRVKNRFFQYPQTKYLPLRKPDLAAISARELGVIDDVLSRLSDMTAAQVSRYSHSDVPWLTTEKGKPIEYESVFYRTAPYSVRDDDEGIQGDHVPAGVPE